MEPLCALMEDFSAPWEIYIATVNSLAFGWPSLNYLITTQDMPE